MKWIILALLLLAGSAGAQALCGPGVSCPNTCSAAHFQNTTGTSRQTTMQASGTYTVIITETDDIVEVYDTKGDWQLGTTDVIEICYGCSDGSCSAGDGSPSGIFVFEMSIIASVDVPAGPGFGGPTFGVATGEGVADGDEIWDQSVVFSTDAQNYSWSYRGVVSDLDAGECVGFMWDDAQGVNAAVNMIWWDMQVQQKNCLYKP